MNSVNGMKDRVKNRLHSEKKGPSIRGQVTGLWKKDQQQEERKEHESRPLSQLKDPSSFGPPPRHVAVGGGSSSASAAPPPPPPGYASRASPSVPSRSGYAPAEQASTYTQSHAQPQPEEEVEVEEERESVPYRVDTTGLSTSHLPPPPTRRDGANGRTPSPRAPTAAARPAPPSLPPRLPPRAPSSTASSTQSPARSPAPETSRQSSYINQSAANRLGNAGVSVPGFGIGKSSNPTPAPPGRNPSSESTSATSRFGSAATAANVNELQSRFSKLGTSSSSPPSTGAPAQGTTFAQKQTAMETASNFHKDPSSVSMSDARSAASTINNFRQRHGDQVAAGVNSAKGYNQKYGISDKLGGFAGSAMRAAQSQAEPTSPAQSTTPNASSAASLAAGKKKPPPPPPKKKPGLAATSGAGAAPPPVPLSTRPQF